MAPERGKASKAKSGNGGGGDATKFKLSLRGNELGRRQMALASCFSKLAAQNMSHLTVRTDKLRLHSAFSPKHHISAYAFNFSYVKTFLLSCENHPQNVPLHTPKVQNGTTF